MSMDPRGSNSKASIESRVARRANEDAARRGQPLEPACQIYGLSPHVVAELLRANDSSGDLSRCQPHADVERKSGLRA